MLPFLKKRLLENDDCFKSAAKLVFCKLIFEFTTKFSQKIFNPLKELLYFGKITTVIICRFILRTNFYLPSQGSPQN